MADLIRPPRRLHFSLRSLILFMLAAGAVAGWAGIKQRRILRQQAAISQLAPHRPGVSWRGGYVVQVAMSGEGVEDAALLPLMKLPRLERLTLIDTAITDKGMETIGQMESLTDLVLINAAVTDAGVARVASLGRLASLRLDGASITDAGLLHVARLKSLRRLDLANTSITDAGIVHLHEMRHLERLYIQGAHVSDQGANTLRAALPGTKIGH